MINDIEGAFKLSLGGLSTLMNDSGLAVEPRVLTEHRTRLILYFSGILSEELIQLDFELCQRNKEH